MGRVTNSDPFCARSPIGNGGAIGTKSAAELVPLVRDSYRVIDEGTLVWTGNGFQVSFDACGHFQSWYPSRLPAEMIDPVEKPEWCASVIARFGDREHGASVHFVVPEVDSGAVVAQAVIPVPAGATAESLAAAVLAVEHPLLVAVLRLAVAGRLAERDGQPTVDGHRLFMPLRLDSAGSLAPAPGSQETP